MSRRDHDAAAEHLIEDLHLQAAELARHTPNALRGRVRTVRVR
jgi:hypothetical protein